MKSASIKRVAAAFGILALVAMARPSMAAFTSVRKSTISASVTINAAAGQVAMFVEPRNLGSSTTASGLTFTVSALPVGNQGNWVISNQYLHMTATVTASGGVQIYTDNRATDLFASSFTGTNNPAGLVDNTVRNQTLPMIWKVADNLSAPVPAASAIGTLVAPDFITTDWFYFTDVTDADVDGPGSDGAFPGNSADYVTVVQAGNGGSAGAIGGMFHYNNGPGVAPTAIDPFNGFGDRTTLADAIYVASSFTTATAGRTYTGTIRVEAFTE